MPPTEFEPMTTATPVRRSIECPFASKNDVYVII